MPSLLIVFCFLVVSISIYLEKDVLYPLTLFFSIWGIIFFAYIFKFFGIYEISHYTYFIIFVGLLFFLFGSIMAKVYIEYVFSIKRKIRYKNKYVLNKRLLHVLTVSSFLILIILASKSFTLLLSGYNLHDIRYSSKNEVFTSVFLAILYNYIAKPVLLLLIPFSAIKFYSESMHKFRMTKFTLVVIAMIFLDLLIQGGRFILLYFLVHYVVIFLLYKKEFKLSRKIKRSLVLLCISIVFLIVYVTLMRGSSILETIYIYSVGGIPHLDVRLDEFYINPSYTYGVLSLQGFIRPIFVVLEKISIIKQFPDLVNYAESIHIALGNWRYIGNEITYNAFVTLFYYFYVDFGIIGVMIGSFVYGYICCKFYWIIKFKKNIKYVILYSILILSLVTSMVRFQFTEFPFALSIVYLNFIFKKVRII